MAKFVLFLILLVPVVGAGNWFLLHPGDVQLTWLGYDIRTSIAVAAAALAMSVLAVALLVIALWQLVTWPERHRARRRYRTLTKGLRALTHGVTALALGDEKHARIALKKAAAALPGEPLPQLLTAQLLQRQGDHEAARGQLRALLKHEATAQLASHRLIEQHMTDKEYDAALALAESLHEHDASDRWLTLTLIDLYSRYGNVAALLRLTEGWKFHSPLSRSERHRYAAIAYYLQALSKTEPRAKLTSLRHAVGYAPDFLPAIVPYAALLAERGEHRAARKLLLSAWKHTPDSSLIAPILASIAHEKERLQPRLIEVFCNEPKRIADTLLAASHAVARGEYNAALHALDALVSDSRESLKLRADIAQATQSDEAANRLLARALQAPALAAWECGACGHAHSAWQLHCSHCGAFDAVAPATARAAERLETA